MRTSTGSIAVGASLDAGTNSPFKLKKNGVGPHNSWGLSQTVSMGKDTSGVSRVERVYICEGPCMEPFPSRDLTRGFCPNCLGDVEG